jgi:hypothetical protein
MKRKEEKEEIIERVSGIGNHSSHMEVRGNGALW